ncbi:MAG: bacterioferritin [Pontibacterium sp.]
MKGNPVVLDALNKLLTNELSAADQYFIHSRMYEDWGLTKLYERISHEHEEELEHASALIERILFLEGTPDVASRDPLKVGKDVPEALANDLEVEYEVGALLKDTIALCEQEKDYQTREILEKLLEDTEEDHTYWLEQQLRLIKMVGIENYLQTQMG